MRGIEGQQREAKKRLPSAISKRSVKIGGYKTSVGFEDAFWESLKEIATSRSVGVYELVSMIDRVRQHGNLSSAIRLFVLEHYRKLAEAKRP